MELTLGKRIAQHRKKLGLTQDQLAESLGVTAQAVSKWENDQSCPDINMLPKLAQIFGVSIDSLLGNDNQPVYEAEIVQPEEKKDKWEFHWDAGRNTNIGIALGVLALGVQLILASYLQRDLSFGSLLWPTALFIFGAWGLFPKFSFFRFGCFLFGGYFLLEKWELLSISFNGNIVFPVILVLLGLSLLMDAIQKKPKTPIISIHKEGKQNCDYVCEDEHFELDASFGNMTQVVNLPRLSRGSIDTSFGNYTIDLTEVETIAAGCRVEVDCSFGETTLLVPSCFYMQQAVSTSFSNVEIIGNPDAAPIGTINLEVDISFGKLIIQYI